MRLLTLAIIAATLSGVAAHTAMADAQEELKRRAAEQLLSLNAELVKELRLKPEELENKKVYARAKVVQKEDGASEMQVEELSVGELKREPATATQSVYIKGTVKPQKDRTWKLSIDEVLPKEKSETPGKSPEENKSK